jgi:hypothetical protein
MFTMNKGEISGNSATASGSSAGGNGVYVDGSNARFVKTGGTIYGYNSTAPDDPYNNKTVKAGAIEVDYCGNAVYAISSSITEYKPVDKLTYNYPNSGNFSGW